MSKKYNVLIVVDLQNCFIQGGSLGSPNEEDLIKYIDLVEDLDTKISQNNYDLVIFSKDSHPLNHSSLSDIINPAVGVYTHHCRNINYNCINKERNSTYMSSEGMQLVKEFLCENFKDYVKNN